LSRMPRLRIMIPITASKAQGQDERTSASAAGETPATDVRELEAILFDLDGVVTETATVHAQAWKRAFDEYLEERAAGLGGILHPFDLEKDYEKYVDGKPRYKGVAGFLRSRDIYLSPGKESDPPNKETICGLGNRKNKYFLEAIRRNGVSVYPTSVDFIRQVRAQGMMAAVVSSSRNCTEVLQAAGIDRLFDAQVDGTVAREWMLSGKPAPDTYLEAARRLGVDPARACVIEDAIAGVEAGKAGNFGLVVGVCRGDQPELLEKCGADFVVSDLGELTVEDGRVGLVAKGRPGLEHLAELRDRTRGRQAVFFLDYDGTLTPIVERPEMAVMSDDTRAALKELVACCTVVVISGRQRGNVQRLVGLDGVIYAGSHGFDIAGPAGMEFPHEEGARFVPTIAEAAEQLHKRLTAIKGVIVENKVYDVAVHFRMVKPDEVERVEAAVDDVLALHPTLRKTIGKKVFELRPDINWDKGRAVLWLLHAMNLEGPDVMPFYLGDDVTDRDAFEAIRGKGISILVADRSQPTIADYRLVDPDEVRIFLKELAAMFGKREE
jgi:trehalose 6-phosphate phosphatase